MGVRTAQGAFVSNVVQHSYKTYLGNFIIIHLKGVLVFIQFYKYDLFSTYEQLTARSDSAAACASRIESDLTKKKAHIRQKVCGICDLNWL